jgi:hypothetical protein
MGRGLAGLNHPRSSTNRSWNSKAWSLERALVILMVIAGVGMRDEGGGMREEG